MTTSSDRQDQRTFAQAVELIAQAASLEAFEYAVDLIESAANDGHAEATAMLATMEAVGAGRPRDWDRALDCLVVAAERESEHARGQLRLLERVSRSGEETADETYDDDWRALRNAIDVQRLLDAPPAVSLSDRPRLREFRRFARPEECRWVIEQLGPRLERAVVWDGVSGEGVIDPYRSNSAVGLTVREMDVVIAVLRARISTATLLPEFIFEIPQLMHYTVGEEFKPHHDYLDPDKPGFATDYARRGQRMGTFLIYLNEDFDGGETEFPRANISFRGRTGDALFFANVTRDGQPDPLTLHTGRPPTRGEKWLLSQWIRERPPAEVMVPAHRG